MKLRWSVSDECAARRDSGSRRRVVEDGRGIMEIVRMKQRGVQVKLMRGNRSTLVPLLSLSYVS